MINYILNMNRKRKARKQNMQYQDHSSFRFREVQIDEHLTNEDKEKIISNIEESARSARKEENENQNQIISATTTYSVNDSKRLSGAKEEINDFDINKQHMGIEGKTTGEDITREEEVDVINEGQKQDIPLRNKKENKSEEEHEKEQEEKKNDKNQYNKYANEKVNENKDEQIITAIEEKIKSNDEENETRNVNHQEDSQENWNTEKRVLTDCDRFELKRSYPVTDTIEDVYTNNTSSYRERQTFQTEHHTIWDDIDKMEEEKSKAPQQEERKDCCDCRIY